MVLVSLVLFSAAIGLLVLVLVRWLVGYIRLVKSIKLPSPGWLPIIGNAHLILGRPVVAFKKLNGIINQYKAEGTVALWMGTTPTVFIFRAELLEQFLTSTKHMEKSFQYAFFQPWLGLGLLTSAGDKWRTRRKMLTPAFHFQILNDFLQVICEQVDVFGDRLVRMADTDKAFNIIPFVSHCALDIICETAMGERIGAQKQCDSTYVKAVYRMSEIIMVRTRSPWQWSDPLFRLSSTGREHDRMLKIMHGFTDSVITKRLAEKKSSSEVKSETKKKRLAFLDLLLQESEEMEGTLTKMDIREEVDTFMFEGHDTTAAAMSWACHLIATHPEVQERLHDEVDQVFGSSDRHPTMDDLKEMPYLECVIKETLRMFPPVPFIGRRTSESFHLDGQEVPAGTDVVLFIYVLHRDERFFPDPEKFEPDRFLQEEASNRNPFAYIPFSAGPRNCIGQKFAMMELKVELSSLLRKFRFESAQSGDESRPKATIVLRPDMGVFLKLYSRT